jgi:hypothetical protein
MRSTIKSEAPAKDRYPKIYFKKKKRENERSEIFSLETGAHRRSMLTSWKTVSTLGPWHIRAWVHMKSTYRAHLTVVFRRSVSTDQGEHYGHEGGNARNRVDLPRVPISPQPWDGRRNRAYRDVPISSSRWSDALG